MADVKVSALPAGTATPTSLVPAVTGGVTQRVTVKSIVDLASTTVDTTKSGGLVGITSSPNLPIQQWSDEMALKAAFQDRGVEFSRVKVNGPGDAGDSTGGEGWVISTAAYFGRLYYGSSNPTPRAGEGPGYELPSPTGDGYLRCDQDPTTGWYFAEPVLVSGAEPPPPAGGNAIWIDPTGTSTGAGTGEFTTDSPITVAEDPIVEQEDGTPIGLSADGSAFHQPLITGAIPVVVNGKKYLIPICDV